MTMIVSHVFAALTGLVIIAMDLYAFSSLGLAVRWLVRRWFTARGWHHRDVLLISLALGGWVLGML